VLIDFQLFPHYAGMGHINSETNTSNARYYSALVPGDSAESLKLNNLTSARLLQKMPMAFVLINAEIGSEDQVVKELKSVPQVKEAYMVYGVYDIVAKVAADSMDKLKEIITWKVRHLNKVKSTLTMIVIEN
jgi:DNA-binding Lrp family transcriptional regulator